MRPLAVQGFTVGRQGALFVLSTIPASKFRHYINKQDSWELRDERGRTIRSIDKTELLLLSTAGDEISSGVGSTSKLRFIRLYVPLDVMHRIATNRARLKAEDDREKEQQKRRDYFMTPQKYYGEEHVGDHYVFRHIAHRCSAVRPDMPSINRECM